MRIRQGNDFIFLWAIERSGEPEDFSNAVNVRLHFKNFDCVGEVESFQIVDGNIVRVEVSPEWASRLGAYRLILSYEFEDLAASDGDRKCVVDVLAFNIVPKTSDADDVTEMAKTTDIMIGLKGEKGEAGSDAEVTKDNVETALGFTPLPKSGGTLENYVEKLTTTTGAINLNSGNVFHRDATANTTFSITNAKAGAHSFTLIITMGATVRTLTFPASVKWQDGEVPEMTVANKTYILTFMTINSGTTWFGMEGGSF